VIGSGIAAERLSPGQAGLQFLENSTATALGLAVLISPGSVPPFLAAQVVGGLVGAALVLALYPDQEGDRS
jgi:hypothetical protein